MQYDPSRLDNTEILNTGQIDKLIKLNQRCSLKSLMNVPRNVEELGIDFIHSSAQIEGNTYSAADTITLLKNGVTAGGKQHTDAVMILNMRSAYNIILLGGDVYTRDYVKDLHYQLSLGLVQPNEGGVVRSSPVTIGSSDYTPLSSPEKLNEEMKYLINQLSSVITNPFDKAIYAHLNLCYLQYFIDCNKRTARFYQNAILIQEGLLPLLFNEKSAEGYVESVVTYYETGNTDNYVKWFIEAYEALVDRLDPKDPILPSRIFT